MSVLFIYFFYFFFFTENILHLDAELHNFLVLMLTSVAVS